MHPFFEQTLHLLDTELARIQTAFARLAEDFIWEKPKHYMNSIGNLCLHLAGNERQNIVSGIGGTPFIRSRSNEFFAEDGYTADELCKMLTSIREQSRMILQPLTEQDFAKNIRIEYPPNSNVSSYTKPLLQLVYHTTAHYSFHTGQIILLTKFFQTGEENLLQWQH